MEYLKGHTLIQSMAYGEGDYFIWKFNADGTGIEQEYYHGSLESPVSFTYTYDAKTTVLTVTYKEDGDLVPTDIDTYYVTFSGNTMTTRQFFDDEIGDDSYVTTWTKQ